MLIRQHFNVFARIHNIQKTSLKAISLYFRPRLKKNKKTSSILFSFTAHPLEDHSGAEATQLAIGERWGTPWTGRQSITQPFTLTLTPMGNLESPINLTCMFLVCWRKPQYPERTHAGTGRTCKLHTERPQLAGGFQPTSQLI